eukprot:3563028-Alexandrium_andersonii.AAC.1
MHARFCRAGSSVTSADSPWRVGGRDQKAAHTCSASERGMPRGAGPERRTRAESPAAASPRQ